MSTSTISIFVSQLSSGHLWFLLFIVCFYSFVMSWILLFHWNLYGLNTRSIKRARFLYITVLSLLLVLMGALTILT